MEEKTSSGPILREKKFAVPLPCAPYPPSFFNFKPNCLSLNQINSSTNKEIYEAEIIQPL